MVSSPERAAAVHERPLAVGRRRLEHGVQADGERVGEHGLLVAHLVGDGEELRLVRREERGERPAGIAGSCPCACAGERRPSAKCSHRK